MGLFLFWVLFLAGGGVCSAPLVLSRLLDGAALGSAGFLVVLGMLLGAAGSFFHF